jgi:hypothetical protein
MPNLFGQAYEDEHVIDMPYTPGLNRVPPTLRNKILRIIAARNPLEDTKRLLALALSGAGVTGAIAKTVYDAAVTQYNTPPKASTKRDHSISPNLVAKKMRFEDENIDMGGEESKPEASSLARTSIASGGIGDGNHETPITKHPAQWGLPETMTVVCPLTAYFSVASPLVGSGATTTLVVRMTTPYDPLINTPAAPVAGAAIPATGQIANLPIGYSSSALTYGTLDFPKKWSGNEIPAYRDYWAKMYDVYTVIGCQKMHQVLMDQILQYVVCMNRMEQHQLEQCIQVE